VSDADRIVINDEVPEEQPAEATTEETPVAERPEWLPEKFKTPEDMATAYQQLETKLSSPEPEESKGTATIGQLEPSDMQKYETEFLEKGQISEDSYAELVDKYGASRDLVDSYINGQKALSDAMVNNIYSSVGGEDNYKAMTEWATANLPESEIAAFDNIMDCQNQDAVNMAIQGLYARYANSDGPKPSLLQGKATESAANSFRSLSELRQAMSDPRYKQDPAYRKDVEQRLAVSNIL